MAVVVVAVVVALAVVVVVVAAVAVAVALPHGRRDCKRLQYVKGAGRIRFQHLNSGRWMSSTMLISSAGRPAVGGRSNANARGDSAGRSAPLALQSLQCRRAHDASPAQSQSPPEDTKFDQILIQLTKLQTTAPLFNYTRRCTQHINFDQ